MKNTLVRTGSPWSIVDCAAWRRLKIAAAIIARKRAEAGGDPSAGQPGNHGSYTHAPLSGFGRDWHRHELVPLISRFAWTVDPEAAVTPHTGPDAGITIISPDVLGFVAIAVWQQDGNINVAICAMAGAMRGGLFVQPDGECTEFMSGRIVERLSTLFYKRHRRHFTDQDITKIFLSDLSTSVQDFSLN